MAAMSRLFARLALIAMLVLSQALYAGHSFVHSDGDQPTCQVCLQASGGSAAAVCTVTIGPTPIYFSLPPLSHREAATISSFTNPHPARAPPTFLPA